MSYGILTVVPILTLIFGALLTKKISEMMILSSIVGAIFVYRWDFFSGYISLMYTVLSNPTYQFLLILLMLFGAVVRQFQCSGALQGFRTLVSKGPAYSLKPLPLSWFLSFLLFIDDYLNILAVSFAMKDEMDRRGIPREHLAFQVCSVCPSLSVLIPLTSWTAFTIGLLKEHGLGFYDYVRAIPLMFFPQLMLLLTLLLSLGFFPKVGLLKKSYERVESGGPTLLPESDASGLMAFDATSSKESSASNFAIPILVLILVVLWYENSIVHGLIAALITQGILYISRGLMTGEEFLNHSFEGAASMSRIAIIIFFAYLLNETNTIMGFSEFLIHFVGPSFPPFLLPPVVFLLIAAASFATSGYWVIQVITLPVVIPLAGIMSMSAPLIIAAMMSGVAFGSMFCFYSDIVFITATATGVSNMRQVRVSAPYVLGVALLTSILYLILGFLL